MQTFLPLADIGLSVKVLDSKRLGKQRVEALQILNTLEGRSQGWRHHPAVKMWVGYEWALRCYHNQCIQEWLSRGYSNNMPLMEEIGGCPDMPPWFGDDSFHASHRSNLLRKDPVFYGKYGWSEDPLMPYVWPSVREAVQQE